MKRHILSKKIGLGSRWFWIILSFLVPSDCTIGFSKFCWRIGERGVGLGGWSPLSRPEIGKIRLKWRIFGQKSVEISVFKVAFGLCYSEKASTIDFSLKKGRTTWFFFRVKLRQVRLCSLTLLTIIVNKNEREIQAYFTTLMRWFSNGDRINILSMLNDPRGKSLKKISYTLPKNPKNFYKNPRNDLAFVTEGNRSVPPEISGKCQFIQIEVVPEKINHWPLSKLESNDFTM